MTEVVDDPGMPAASAVALYVQVGALRFVAATTPGAPTLLPVADLTAYLAGRGVTARAALATAMATLEANLSPHARETPPALTLDDALLVAGALGAALPKGAGAEIASAFREAELAFAAFARSRTPSRGIAPTLSLATPDEIPPPPPGLSRAQLADREALLAILDAHRWNKVRVAEKLGIPRRTLYRRFARFGIPVSEDRGGTRVVAPKVAEKAAPPPKATRKR